MQPNVLKKSKIYSSSEDQGYGSIPGSFENDIHLLKYRSTSFPSLLNLAGLAPSASGVKEIDHNLDHSIESNQRTNSCPSLEKDDLKNAENLEERKEPALDSTGQVTSYF